MKIGTHVSIAGGLDKAPANAAKVGAEVFQIFSRSPHGGPVKPITPDVQTQFQAAMDQYGFQDFYIHAPYFINFASAKNNVYYGSISVIREELARGTKLRCKALMTHLGSFGELTDEEGIEKEVKAVAKVMDGYRGSTQLLLEISAGAGRVVGDTFEELAAILDDKRLKDYNVGVCLDTCHIHVAGYDIVSADGYIETMKLVESTVGFDAVRVWHCNDAKAAMGSKLDRHEHIGEGTIGAAAFRRLLHDARFAHAAFIAETPVDAPGDEARNVGVLRTLAAGA